MQPLDKILVCKQSPPMYKLGDSVCVCDYANHLWLLTEPQILPRVAQSVCCHF